MTYAIQELPRRHALPVGRVVTHCRPGASSLIAGRARRHALPAGSVVTPGAERIYPAKDYWNLVAQGDTMEYATTI